MLQLPELAVSPGVAIGKVLILNHRGFGITHSQIQSSDRQKQIQRLSQAVVEATIRLSHQFAKSAKYLGTQFGDLVGAYLRLFHQAQLPPIRIAEA